MRKAHTAHAMTQGHHSTAPRILSAPWHTAQRAQHTTHRVDHILSTSCTQHAVTKHILDTAHLIPSPPNSQHTTEYTENTAECLAPQAPHSEHITQYTEAQYSKSFHTVCLAHQIYSVL